MADSAARVIANDRVVVTLPAGTNAAARSLDFDTVVGAEAASLVVAFDVRFAAAGTFDTATGDAAFDVRFAATGFFDAGTAIDARFAVAGCLAAAAVGARFFFATGFLGFALEATFARGFAAVALATGFFLGAAFFFGAAFAEGLGAFTTDFRLGATTRSGV